MDTEISGYASLFWTRDLNDDVTAVGAFGASLAVRGVGGVKMLCQHDADRPVGVWDEVVEDARGLFVRGRIFDVTPEGRMCAALVRAGAMDGLSIGFKTTRARPDDSGRLRVLTEVDLWEVSIVTFPMLPGARIDTFSLLPREKVAA
ncbi:MAG: HK97 family phage prohead protease [Caulobacter sp.]|nr:HK97 family phage prohead protease [Caulobacter sp.]